MLNTFTVLGLVFLMGVLWAKQATLLVWTLSYTVVGAFLVYYSSIAFGLKSLLIIGFAILAFVNVKPLRRKYISEPIFRMAKQVLPPMSKTEKEALEAGTIGWEGALFSGKPDFNQLLTTKPTELSSEEHHFLMNEVHTLCEMINDWDITHNRADMPQEIWSYLKENKFFGMIIPKEYGGLGFSATAQSAVLSMVYGRSITVASTIAVPNSLGPAELLLKYGTDEQKNYYLPRLADGREIPCFALTGPDAGSDAASIPDQGVVCRQVIDEKEVIGIRVSWNKRYITLCPVATLIGLAFRLFDPDQILGKGEDIGISCALIPANTPGVIRGRRHFPLNSVFQNGPTQGKDVFIPLDYLIGGATMAGQGWRMLMECLSAGRAISLPSSACGGAQMAALASGAYARVRKQFNQPIAKFEGIEEALGRIGAYTYLIDAGLSMTTTAIDQGEKSAVAGAILKYHTTELSQQVCQDAMDIHAGKGICLGPNNYLGRGYQGAPIAITVEGANILTRNLIIFGQGVIRCHPYLFKIMQSIQQKDLNAFDQMIWQHSAFILANSIKSFLFGMSDGKFTNTPKSRVKHYYQLINRYSAQLAFLADFSMLNLGGALKRKERISARLGDMLSYLYLASAVLKRFHFDNEPEEDLPLVDWSCQQMFYQCEQAMEGVIVNYPSILKRAALKLILQPFGRRRRKASDQCDHHIAKLLTSPNDARLRLTRFVYAQAIKNCPLGQLEAAFQKICKVERLEKKINQCLKKGALSSLTLLEQIDEARIKGLFTKEEAMLLINAEKARQEVIAVDDFHPDDLVHAVSNINEKKKSDLLNKSEVTSQNKTMVC